MFGLGATQKKLFEHHWLGELSEYVTAVAWSTDGKSAASSATGEVLLWEGENSQATLMLSSAATVELSIDCLDFSPNGQFLAAGGQDGKVSIWHLKPEPELVTTLENAPKWVDQLSWNPTRNQLAFSVGRYVPLWDAESQEKVVTLPFESSSVWGISWHPRGEYLATAGDLEVKVWNAKDWDDDSYVLILPAASIAIAWSPDGEYIAASSLDYAIAVWSWKVPYPWVMRGFPGKIRNLAWSGPFSGNAPLLAASSAKGIAIWKKQADDREGWDPSALELHNDVVPDLGFQPKQLLLASASDDGWLYLWQRDQQVVQILEGAANGFFCLAWHPERHQLVAGGKSGELLIWSESKLGQEFA